MARRSLSVVALAFSLCWASCTSVTQVAPPVTPAMIAASGDAAPADLERGRRVFAGPCTTCHSADPVGKYSIVRWREIVADMAQRSDLSEPDKSALLAYLTAALKNSAPTERR